MSLLDWLSDGLGLGGGQMPPGMYPGGGEVPMPPVQPPGMDAPNLADPMTQAMPGGQGGAAPLPDPATDAMPSIQGGAAPTPAVPLPVPRPAGAPGAPPTDISAASAPPGAPTSLAPPGAVEQFAPSMPGSPPGGPTTSKGILESALGLSPERGRQVSRSLAAGLKSVGENWNKPGLAALSGSAGSAMEGGEKRGDKDTDQRTKLLQQMISAQGKGDQAGYVKAQTEYTKVKMEAEKAKMANPDASKKPQAAAFTEEQKLFKINDAIAKDPRIKAAKENLVTLQKQGTPKDVAAAQKTLDDLVNTTKKDLTESLRTGSQTNPYKVTSQQELEKVAKPGDIFINPADGKPYIFRGAKKDTTAASGMTPAAAPAPTATPEDDDE